MFSSWWAVGGLLIVFCMAFGGHPVMFVIHGLFCCFGGLGGFLLCWWWLMSDYVWLFISFCLCEILVDVLQAFACLLLVWALVFSEPLLSLFLVVGFHCFLLLSPPLRA